MAQSYALLGYPAPGLRDHIGEVIDINGPRSYLNGTGYVLKASVLGFGGIEFIEAMNTAKITVSSDKWVAPLTHSGTYYATIRLATTVQAGQAVTQVTIWYYNVSDGAEVTNATDLSAEYIRCFVLGC